MTLLWFIFTNAISVIAEVCLGHYGIVIPFTAMTGFYLTVAYAWRNALFPFLVSCVLLDLGLGRPFPLTWLIVPYVMLIAQYWRQHGNTLDAMLQLIPGLAIGLGALGASLAYTATRSFLSETPGGCFSSRLFIQCLTGSCALMPILTKILDLLAKSLSLKCYGASTHYLITDNEENSWQEFDD